MCDGALFRIHRDGAQIECKSELKRFEDKFYEFLPFDYEGLPIIVTSFTPYSIPLNKDNFMLTIAPEKVLLKRKIRP